ncbi:hypothetical protein BDZ91DRAFT_720628 [Kalaharituber pfeilii]|nr:hypothetical protein BDZ91DRAFT_720628 [Kalaharituber pfeilii]
MSATWSGTPSIWGPTLSIRMALLTISLAGVQVVWGFEMAYCSPYLLSLGLTKSIMSLVWIVGPLSGLITQPIVGAIADRSRFRWGRRRPFMLLGTILAGAGLLILGWVTEIVGLVVTDGHTARILSIIIAILAIYVLDFSINAVQASCRALVVDSLPAQQQQIGSAWASRMIAIGNLAGYFVGTLDLKSIFGTAFGDTQIKQLCFLSFMTLLTTVSITSLSVAERVLVSRSAEDNKGLFAVLKTIFNTMFHLPTRIGAVCRIWFFAWIGWFPFMLYSTTFVGEVLQRYDVALRETLQKSEDLLGDIARVGSMALVVYSTISLAASLSLPWIIQTPESESLRKNRSDKHRKLYAILEFLELYRPDLATAWFIGHIMFAVAMFLTLFIRSVAFATFVVGSCGIPWALMTWAPFAFVGEEINRLQDDVPGIRRRHGTYNRLSTDDRHHDEEQYPMMELSHPSLGGTECPSVPALMDTEVQSPEGGNELSGIYLGILNVFACLPQFVSTFISFVVFSILEPGKSPEFADGGDVDREGRVVERGKVNAIAVVMGMGGFSVLLAAHYTMRFKNG